MRSLSPVNNSVRFFIPWQDLVVIVLTYEAVKLWLEDGGVY